MQMPFLQLHGDLMICRSRLCCIVLLSAILKLILSSSEGLLKVGNDIIDMFSSSRNANQVLSDTASNTLIIR
jgi:hypothetical protein